MDEVDQTIQQLEDLSLLVYEPFDQTQRERLTTNIQQLPRPHLFSYLEHTQKLSQLARDEMKQIIQRQNVETETQRKRTLDDYMMRGDYNEEVYNTLSQQKELSRRFSLKSSLKESYTAMKQAQETSDMLRQEIDKSNIFKKMGKQLFI